MFDNCLCSFIISIYNYNLIFLILRMALKNVENYVVAMVIFVAVGFLSYLLSMFLPALTKEIMLFCICRLVYFSLSLLTVTNLKFSSPA